MSDVEMTIAIFTGLHAMYVMHVLGILRERIHIALEFRDLFTRGGP